MDKAYAFKLNLAKRRAEPPPSAPGTTPIPKITKLLCPIYPYATLSLFLDSPKNTVRNWVLGYRRAPLAKLESLLGILKDHYNTSGQYIYDLEEYIKERRAEPPRRLAGFCAAAADGRVRVDGYRSPYMR